MSLNDEPIEQQRMASRADATTLEDNHDCEEMELLTFPHNLGRDSPFSSCPECVLSMYQVCFIKPGWTYSR